MSSSPIGEHTCLELGEVFIYLKSLLLLGSQMACTPMFKVGYLNLDPDGRIEGGNLPKVNEHFIHFWEGDYFSLTNFDWVCNMLKWQKTE